MRILINLFILSLFLQSFSSSLAQGINLPCDKYTKESEFSWKPEKQYITARLNHFYGLKDQIISEYESHNFSKVKKLAKEYLELANIYQCNWNYGNAIHDANRFLGLGSLKEGDINKAADYLIKAGKSPGSPTLNSFGPELDLANELLKLGKANEVKIYLYEIKSFWKMNNKIIDKWLLDIENGKKPDLDRFSAVTSSSSGNFFNIFFLLSEIWPVLFTLLILYFSRLKINKKLQFSIVSITFGYIVMYCSYWITSTSFFNINTIKFFNNFKDFFIPIFLQLFSAFILPSVIILVINFLYLRKKKKLDVMLLDKE